MLRLIGESGHRGVPKEGQKIRALAKPRHGRLEGLYPNWFSKVEDQSQGRFGFYLLEKGKAIRGVTSDEGWQLNESGEGPLSYVHIKPVFEITKEKVEKFSTFPVTKITLTRGAAAELSQSMKAAKANSQHWFVMMLDGEKLNGQWSCNAFVNRSEIILFSPNIGERLGLEKQQERKSPK